MVAQREALNDQREAARRALRHRQGDVLAGTHRYEAAARQNLVSALARDTEGHSFNEQMQVRQLEQEANARFSHGLNELLYRFSQDANQALEDQLSNLVTEVTRCDGCEMSNYTIYVQNWVFKHHTRKTPHNDKIKNMLDCISTWQDWFKINSNIERRLKNIDLFNRVLDRNSQTSTKRRRTLTRSTMSQRWQSKIWVSLSGTSESDLSVRELRREIMHLSVWREPQFDSRCLCGWQYWIINIVSKPCYGTSKKASTTSWKVNPMPRAATLAATPTTPPASISKNSSGSTQILLHRQLAYQLEVQKLQSHPLIMKGQEREKQSQFNLTDGFTRSSGFSRVAVLWIGEVEDAKSIDDLITSASTFGALVSDKNSWFQDCTWTQEDRNKKVASRNKSPQEKAKLNQRRDHLRAVRLVGWSTVATKKPAIYWKSQ